MAKLYKVLVNEGNGAEAKAIQVLQGVGDSGTSVRIVAQRGVRYELQDTTKTKATAPDQVRVKRMGKNLALMFDGSQKPDVVVEDFYAVGNTNDASLPLVTGLAENGNVYEYIPQDPALSSVTSALADGNTPVLMALGGGALGETFVLSALPIAAAAGGVGGWAVAGAAVGAAALAGGGGGGGAAAVVVPSKPTGRLAIGAVNDTGASAEDGITSNQNPTYSGVADKGATVEVTVNDVVYKTTASAQDGTYSIPLTNDGKLLADGVYTPKIKVSNATGGSITSDGAPFTIDHTADKNQDASKSPTSVVDENSNVVVSVAIGSIDDAITDTTAASGSKDTGRSKTDFITSDGTLNFSGTALGFKVNGDLVHLQVITADGSVVVNQYVTPDAQGEWSFNNQNKTLETGDYTIKATIEDLAGNEVKAAVEQPLKIEQADVLVARNDTATVTENQPISVDASKGVMANDGDTTAPEVKVTKIGNVDVGNETVTVTGLHGQLDMFADGHYEYRPTDESLTGGQKVVDTFTYEVQALGTTRTTTATLTMNITGVNDSAEMTLSPANAQAIVVNGSTTYENLEAPIKILDADKNEAAIQGIAAKDSTTSSGALGALITTGDGKGNYGFSYAKTGAQKAEINQHDLFSFTSIDTTANTTLDFVITGSGTVTKQEFNVAPLGTELTVKGLIATGSTSTNDSLKLNGSSTGKQTTFDFSDPAITTFTSIEKIEIHGSGPNTVRLSLASLMQGDTNGAQSQQLFVTGDANDALYFTSSIAAVDAGLVYVDSVQYHKYSFGSDDLLVQAAIMTSITFNG